MLYSYVSQIVETGGWSGVPRFDAMLRKVYPGLVSVTKLGELRPDDVVITDNHLSLDVPEGIRTVVVHHGCAETHYERDPYWRTTATHDMVARQQNMFRLAGRAWIAPSAWVACEFMRIHHGIMGASVIPHWVDRIDRLARQNSKPVIIGDWRGWNKGEALAKHLSRLCPQWDFRPLKFRHDAGRREQYGTADLYLCLSLSEGGSYSMCDAEAASLPIVTTNVGNYQEFDDAEVIDWRDRQKTEVVIKAIEKKLREGRKKPSFYNEYTYKTWSSAWREVVQ